MNNFSNEIKYKKIIFLLLDQVSWIYTSMLDVTNIFYIVI